MVSLLVALSLANVALWAALALDRRRAWPRELVLDRDPPHAHDSVVAIVPARDEAAVIARCAESLVRQSHRQLRVLVVDDGSGDCTGEAARRVAAGHPEREVVVIAAGERREGWSGKLSALAFGVAAAEERWPEAEWWLFTDADIEHRSDSVRALLALAERERRDLVSVMARLHAESLWERLIVPPFVWFFHLLYPFRAVADPDSRIAAAAGGCVLVRREALARAGGLAAIRGALIDDVALGRAVKASGGRIWLGLDRGIVSIRPYPRLADLWRMVSRSAFVQLRYRWSWLVAVVLGLLVGFVAPPLLLAAGLLLLATEEKAAGTTVAVAAALAWLLQYRLLLPAVRHHRVARRWAWTLPLSSALYGAMTVSSAIDHLRGRSSTWKGRIYRGGASTTSPEESR